MIKLISKLKCIQPRRIINMNPLITKNIAKFSWNPQSQFPDDPFIAQNMGMVRSVYTSNMFQIQENEITQYLEQNNIEYRSSPNQSYISLKYCPFCKKPHNNENSNFYTLIIDKKRGCFICFRATCNIRGSWFDFKNLINGTLSIDNLQQNHINIKQKEEQPQKKIDEGYYYLKYQALVENEVNDTGFQQLLQRIIQDRKINTNTLKSYKVGLSIEKFNQAGQYIEVECINFPMYRLRSKQEKDNYLANENNKSANKEGTIRFSDEHSEISKIKIRGIGKENKKFMRIEPAGAAPGIFGMHLVNPDTEEIVITEGEFDSMAVYQVTGICSISLPFGATSIPDYLIKWLDSLPKLRKIYLWLDEDDAGRINAPIIAKKLGDARTVIVRTITDKYVPKDANDALRIDEQLIPKFLSQAKSRLKENIIQFSDIKELVYQQFLRQEERKGIQCNTLRIFNETLKGLRKGEMTVLTGPTGSGKTTLLSQLSLELCEKGVGTLWCSFEIKNEVLIPQMMLQHSGINLYKEIDKYQEQADLFQNLPLYFMNFHGSQKIDVIMDTIQYAVYAFQISHVILDNLQFLLGTQAKGVNKFDLQDQTIEKLRLLATKEDIHVSVVIHPKKVNESEDLNISSIFGSAKATQEADNIWIMQNRESFRVIELKKNRFDGDLGRSALGFNKDFKQYFELSLEDVHKLNMKQTTIKEILSKRKDRESKPKRRQADKDILLEESEDNKNVILDSKEPNFFNKEQQQSMLREMLGKDKIKHK